MDSNEQKYKIQIIGPTDTDKLRQSVCRMWSESLLAASKNRPLPHEEQDDEHIS